MTINEMYPTTRAYIANASSKQSDYKKLLKKIGNKYAISEQSARNWIEIVTGRTI